MTAANIKQIHSGKFGTALIAVHQVMHNIFMTFPKTHQLLLWLGVIYLNLNGTMLCTVVLWSGTWILSVAIYPPALSCWFPPIHQHSQWETQHVTPSLLGEAPTLEKRYERDVAGNVDGHFAASANCTFSNPVWHSMSTEQTDKSCFFQSSLKIPLFKTTPRRQLLWCWRWCL